MPSNFPNLNNGDIIDESHVDRYTIPVNDLESGAAWYRDGTGSANAVKVNFSTGNVISSYKPGLLVHFKAAATNTGAATLTVTGPSGDLAAIPLVKKGGQALTAGDITADQVVAAIYAEDSPGVNGRFEVLGSLSSGGGGGLTSPVALSDGGTGATTAAGARNNLDVPSVSDLTTGLSGKASTSHNHAAGDITSGSLGLARGGTNADLSATGGAGQVLKQSTTGGSITVGALTAGDMPTGIDAAKIGGGAVNNTELSYLDGVTGSIQSQIDAKAGSVHTHAASDITSGTLPLARGGTGAGTASGARTNLGAQAQDNALDEISALSMAKGDVFVHNGTEVTKLGPGSNGQVLTSDSTQATGLKWAAATGGGGASNLDGLSDVDISSPASGQVLRHNGTNFVNAALSADDIGSGSVSNTEFGYLDGVTGGLQSQLDAKQEQDDALDEISSLTLTKGDILVHNGTDVTKLSSGTNGQVLSVDSAEATGLKWVAGSSGGGATTLDGLSDVVIVGTPTSGQIIQHNGTEFTNVSSPNARTGLGIVVAQDQVAYGSASGVTSSAGLVYGSGSLGIGEASPARRLHVKDSAGPQQRWSFSDDKYVEMQVSSGGDLKLSLIGEQIAIGGTTLGVKAVSIGTGSEAAATNTALGSLSKALGYTSTALGCTSQAGTLGTALGAGSNANYYNIAIGYAAQSTISNSCTIGSYQLPMNSIYGGKGESHASPTAWGLKGTAGSGTNVAGADLLLDAGAGSGNASSGSGRLRATSPGTSGTALQNAYSDVLIWKYAALGFYGSAPVTRQQLLAPLINSTGGTASTTVPSVGSSFSASTLNNIHASLIARIASIEAKLVATTLVTQGS